MDDDFEGLVSTLPLQHPRTYPSSDQIEQYHGELPSCLLNYWQEYGWGAFGDGMFWLVNPADFTSTLDAWCHDLVDTDGAYVIGRSAFGKLVVWKRGHGKFMHVVPFEHTIFTFAPNKFVQAGKEDFSFGVMISQVDPDSLDYEDKRENPLFRRALKKLGPIEQHEMYAFVPALSLGGSAEVASLENVNMEAHLHFLAELGETEVLHLDTSRFLR
jgi:hypothetical protein